ncbi:hypothetical protein RI129_010018 [Pyrocoelia pectoralis]|uniref:Uncharacterized protein n=1 Tax=Pyrocoelia pectoralis TaxID=417401 RepID=A0AAN7V9M1_9COLE
MMILLLFYLTAAISQFSCSGIPSSVEDYFWRDYTGIVPKDALACGTDSNGNPTYIAQISVPSPRDPTRSTVDVLPAILEAGAITVYAPYNVDVVYRDASNSSVKVLCVYSSSYYKWHSPKTLLPSFHKYVIVGYESSSPLYLGRAEVNNATVTGKIYANDREAGLIVAYDAGQIYPHSYTILTYYR